MKIEKVDKCWDGPVNCRHVVIFSASDEEIEELRKALEVVDKWKAKALKKVPGVEGADWTMLDYNIISKKSLTALAGKVLVGIEAGACG